jgi:hypothetical protein
VKNIHKTIAVFGGERILRSEGVFWIKNFELKTFNPKNTLAPKEIFQKAPFAMDW